MGMDILLWGRRLAKSVMWALVLPLCLTRAVSAEQPFSIISAQQDHRPDINVVGGNAMAAIDNSGLLQGTLTLAAGDGVVSARVPLSVTLTVNNPHAYPVALQYDSGMTADLWLMTLQGQRLWAWSNEMRFTQALRQSRLGPGQSLTVTFVIPLKALAAIPATGARLEARFMARSLADNRVALQPVVLPLTVQP